MFAMRQDASDIRSRHPFFGGCNPRCIVAGASCGFSARVVWPGPMPRPGTLGETARRPAVPLPTVRFRAACPRKRRQPR